MNILQINSSARRDASHSTRLATRIVERLRDADPEATLIVRDLDRVPASDPGRSRAWRALHCRPTSARPNRRRALRWTTP